MSSHIPTNEELLFEGWQDASCPVMEVDPGAKIPGLRDFFWPQVVQAGPLTEYLERLNASFFWNGTVPKNRWMRPTWQYPSYFIRKPLPPRTDNDGDG